MDRRTDIVNSRVTFATEKSVKLNTFGLDPHPPPLKSLNPSNIFFYKHELTNILVKEKDFAKPKNV